MKKAITMLLILATAFAIAACQKTPEEVIVVGKDTDRIIEMALASQETEQVTSEQTPPTEVVYIEDHYSYSTTAADGKLTISVDAPVWMPALGTLPLAKVSAMGFSQEFTTRIFNYFFANKQAKVIFNHGAPVQTKQDLMELVVLYQKYLAEGTTEKYIMLTAEETEKEIERIKAEDIPAAPENAEDQQEVLSDSTMLPSTYMNDNTSEKIYELNVKTDAGEWLNIRTPANENESSEGFLSYSREMPWDSELYNDSKHTEIKLDTLREQMKIPYDEVMGICNGFFAAAELDDVALSNVYLLEYEEHFAYLLYFVRTVSGVPVGLSNEGVRRNEYALPWEYESINFIIGQDGLMHVAWSGPTQLGEIIKENAKTLSFEEAVKIFETMITVIYEPDTSFQGHERNIKITIDEIRLAPLRIKEINATGRNGLYVPAWIFYGQEYSDDYPKCNFDKHIVLAINAIDGSIIDVQKGY